MTFKKKLFHIFFPENILTFHANFLLNVHEMSVYFLGKIEKQVNFSPSKFVPKVARVKSFKEIDIFWGKLTFSKLFACLLQRGLLHMEFAPRGTISFF